MSVCVAAAETDELPVEDDDSDKLKAALEEGEKEDAALSLEDAESVREARAERDDELLAVVDFSEDGVAGKDMLPQPVADSV